jgi:hypothetical protein
MVLPDDKREFFGRGLNEFFSHAKATRWHGEAGNCKTRELETSAKGA